MREFIQNMHKYDKWANQRVLDRIIVDKPKEEKIVYLFSHILKANDIWLKRIIGEKTDPENFNVSLSLAELQNYLNNLIKDSDNYYDALSDESLKQVIEYSNLQGKKFGNKLSDILTHLFNHATYHRGQIAQLFRREELRAPITDYIVFKREKSV
jgi:uncharacterized damage-inducible protein DinB